MNVLYLVYWNHHTGKVGIQQMLIKLSITKIIS
jgi:hypothetical protein